MLYEVSLCQGAGDGHRLRPGSESNRCSPARAFALSERVLPTLPGSGECYPAQKLMLCNAYCLAQRHAALACDQSEKVASLATFMIVEVSSLRAEATQ